MIFSFSQKKKIKKIAEILDNHLQKIGEALEAVNDATHKIAENIEKLNDAKRKRKNPACDPGNPAESPKEG